MSRTRSSSPRRTDFDSQTGRSYSQTGRSYSQMRGRYDFSMRTNSDSPMREPSASRGPPEIPIPVMHGPRTRSDITDDSNYDPAEGCRQLISDYDDERCKRWELEINHLLIFAGLFSAVVTPFVMEAIKLVQEDPQVTTALVLLQMSMNTTGTPPISTTLTQFSLSTQALRINAFAILSLLIALISVLLSIFCLQWIREYQRKDNLSHQEYLKRRQVRFDGLEAWKVPQLVSLLPVLLISAVILFFICLVDFFNHIHHTLSIIVGATVGVAMLLLISTTILPSLTLLFNIATNPEKPAFAQCPYKSAQSRAFLRLVHIFLRLFIPLEGWHWGQIEPRKNPARLDNLKQALLCENWSHYDAISGFLRIVELDAPLRWAATRFNQTQSAVVTIFRCFQDIDVELVWQAYWKLTNAALPPTSFGAPTHPEIARLLSSEALINYFNGVSEVRHSNSFVHRHLVLYNRIVEFGVPFSELKDVYGYLPQCPDLSWREYGELGIVGDFSFRLRDRTLINLLSQISNPQHGMRFSEIRMILTLFWWTLTESIPEYFQQIRPPVTKTMDDIFQPLQDRIANASQDKEHDHICVAFIDQLIFPIAYADQHPDLLSNLSHLRHNDSFMAFLNGLWTMPVFQGQLRKIRRPEAWNAFLKNTALAYNESTKKFEAREVATPLSQSSQILVPPTQVPPTQVPPDLPVGVTVFANVPHIQYTTAQFYRRIRATRHRTPSFMERQLIIKGSQP